MDINQAFPSKYLKSSELEGRRIVVIMADVKIEEVGRERTPRPVLYFKGKEKGMVLNKTNGARIEAAYGRLTENWFGQPIEIFEQQVEFGKEVVPGLRVAIPNKAPERVPDGTGKRPAPGQNDSPPPPPTSYDGPDLDDDIPF